MKIKTFLFLAAVLGMIFFTAGCLFKLEHLPTRTPLPSPTVPEPTDPKPDVTASLPPTLTLTPTSTTTSEPVTFTIGKNDDMFSVALYYGISLEALKTANPSVNPNAMGIGTVLQIPITPTPIPTLDPSKPTPEPTPEIGGLRLEGEAKCYPDALEGVHCLALLVNEGEETVENASVLFRLSCKDGSSAVETLAFTSLNLLSAGRAMPVYAYFPAPIPKEWQAAAQIENWLPTMPDDGRYAEVNIFEEQMVFSNDKKSALVTGALSLPTKGGQLASLRLLAVAFDENHVPVGLRVWEAAMPIGGEKIPFETYVYSLDAAIDSVELFAEARLQIP